MTAPTRLTHQTKRILEFLLTEPDTERYGLEISEALDLGLGTVYPVLARLERSAWVSSRWEDLTERGTEGRPRRRYYRLNPDNAETVRAALAATTRPSPGHCAAVA